VLGVDLEINSLTGVMPTIQKDTIMGNQDAKPVAQHLAPDQVINEFYEHRMRRLQRQ
jgi:hypothetical protein